MAFTAREVIMVFRGQNYLSGAIRRVGRDIGSLSRGQQLAMQRSQLQIVGQRLQQSRQLAQAELASVQTGTRKLALNQAAAKLSSEEFNNITKLRTIQESQLRNQSDLIKGQIRYEQLSRAAATGKPVGRGLARMDSSQVKRAMEAQFVANERLMEQSVTLERQREAQLAAIGRQSAATQMVTAREVELYEREAQLIQITNTRTRAIDALNEKLVQNAMAMRALPWERFQTGARYVEHAGRVLQMFGLIATATFGYFAKSAADFSTQATLAATQSVDVGNRSVANVQRVGAAINRAITEFLVSGKTTARPEELTKGIYDIFSGLTLPGGQKQRVQEGINLLKQFNSVLTANYGFVQFDDVVQAGITLINDFGVSLKNIPSALNTMQAAVRFGRMTMGQFLSTFNQAAPAAKAAGYSFTDMADAMTYLSRKFPSIRMAATGYARLVEMFARNTQQFAAHGVRITDATGQLLPLDQVVERLIKRFPFLERGGTRLQNFFKDITGQQGTIQGRRVFVYLATGLENYRRLAQQVNKDNNELARSAVAAGTSPGVAWAKFVNQLRGLILLIGQGAIPAFAQLGKPLERLVHWFSTLSPHTQRMIGYVGALIAAFSLLGGTVLAVGGGIASLLISARLLAGFAKEGRGLFGLGFAAKSVTPEIGATAGAASRVINPKTGAVFEDAAQSLGKFGSEAGSVSVEIGALAGAITGIIPLLLVFHKQVGTVVGKIGGLGQVFRIAMLAVAAFTLTRTIGSLRLLTSESLIATTAAERLRLVLGTLSAIGTIVIGIQIVEQIVKHYLPGLSLDGGPAAKVSPPESVRDYARRAANSIKAMEEIRNRIAADPKYAKLVDETQKLLTKGVSAEAIKQRLDKGYSGESGRDLIVTAAINDAAALLRGVRRGTTKPTSAAEHNVVTKQQRSIQQWIALVERARAATLGDPKDVQKALNYERVLKRLNNHFKDQPQLLAAINDVLQSYDSDLKKTTNDANTLGVTFQDVLSSLQDKYNDLLQQEQTIFGQLFQGPFTQSPFIQNELQYGYQLTGRDLTRDLRSQINQFSQFHGLLNNLQRRGAPQALIDQLAQMGPSAIKQIQALARLSQPELRRYFNLFRTAQQDIHRQTMTDLQRQLRSYRRYGRGIALQIVAGLRDENVQLTTALTNMIRKMFPGLPVGTTGAGGRPTHRPQSTTRTPTSKVEQHTHYHVTAPKSEHASVKAQIRQADFHRRNRHR